MAKKINANLSDELWGSLQDAVTQHGLTMSDYMRALLEMWDEDEALKEASTQRARAIRAQARKAQYQRGKGQT